MKILVNAIEFNHNGLELMGNKKDGSRAVTIELNNGHAITMDEKGSGWRRFDTNSPDGRITKTELAVAMLVYSACLSYLIGDEKETMSYSEVAAAAELAETRIDWDAAGYGEEGEEGEKAFCLTDKIAHFEDL